MVLEPNGGGNMAKRVSVVVCTSLLVVIASVSAEPFTVDCQIPFETIKKHRAIDDNCTASGIGDRTDPQENVKPHELQNLAKNNFCATGTPALVTFTSFRKLQQKLYQKAPEAKKWNRKHLPEDRSLLLGVHKTTENVTIGEGTLVTFAGWLMRAKQADFESCNCGKPDDPAIDKTEVTDIHLVVISSSDRKNTPECKSVTAEISPHFRPDQWNAAALKKANKHPLRFTGQLMYDASHRPCPRPPHSTDPARVSSWEIHPVCAIDVCKNKSLNSCKADNDSVWTPLDQWQGDE
jgi:hypothetical protein